MHAVSLNSVDHGFRKLPSFAHHENSLVVDRTAHSDLCVILATSYKLLREFHTEELSTRCGDGAMRLATRLTGRAVHRALPRRRRASVRAGSAAVHPSRRWCSPVEGNVTCTFLGEVEVNPCFRLFSSPEDETYYLRGLLTNVYAKMFCLHRQRVTKRNRSGMAAQKAKSQ